MVFQIKTDIHNLLIFLGIIRLLVKCRSLVMCGEQHLAAMAGFLPPSFWADSAILDG